VSVHLLPQRRGENDNDLDDEGRLFSMERDAISRQDNFLSR